MAQCYCVAVNAFVFIILVGIIQQGTTAVTTHHDEEVEFSTHATAPIPTIPNTGVPMELEREIVEAEMYPADIKSEWGKGEINKILALPNKDQQLTEFINYWDNFEKKLEEMPMNVFVLEKTVQHLAEFEDARILQVMKQALSEFDTILNYGAMGHQELFNDYDRAIMLSMKRVLEKVMIEMPRTAIQKMQQYGQSNAGGVVDVLLDELRHEPRTRGLKALCAAALFEIGATRAVVPMIELAEKFSESFSSANLFKEEELSAEEVEEKLKLIHLIPVDELPPAIKEQILAAFKEVDEKYEAASKKKEEEALELYKLDEIEFERMQKVFQETGDESVLSVLGPKPKNFNLQAALDAHFGKPDFQEKKVEIGSAEQGQVTVNLDEAVSTDEHVMAQNGEAQDNSQASEPNTAESETKSETTINAIPDDATKKAATTKSTKKATVDDDDDDDENVMCADGEC